MLTHMLLTERQVSSLPWDKKMDMESEPAEREGPALTECLTQVLYLTIRLVSLLEEIRIQTCRNTEVRPCEDTVRSATCKPRGEASEETKVADTLISDF